MTSPRKPASRAAGKSAPKVECVACRARIPKDAAVCDACGAPQRELEACPHCRGKAAVKDDDELYLVCNICGGPRVPDLGDRLTLGGAEVRPLKRADGARKKRAMWRIFGAFAAIGLPFVLVLALLVWLIGGVTAGAFTAVLFGLPLAAIAAYARRQAGDRSKEIADALDQAWLSVVADFAEQRDGPLRAKTLADTLGIELARAEQLMALLTVQDVLSTGPRVSVPVDERYEALEEELGEERVRVSTDEAEREAEREAAASAEAAEAKGSLETRGASGPRDERGT